MSQNTSSAVMAQRHEARDSLDFFPTPPWATRALLGDVLDISRGVLTAWEPACGEGHMVRPLAEYFKTVYASDCHDYGAGFPVDDFLIPQGTGAQRRADWIVTNPPFKLAREFALTALDRANLGVALLVRSAWAEGIERYETLFKPHPPAIVAQFCERVPMVKGRLDPKASTATGYAWFVWCKNRYASETWFKWIEACRKRHERPGDYETASAGARQPNPAERGQALTPGGATAAPANQARSGLPPT